MKTSNLLKWRFCHTQRMTKTPNLRIFLQTILLGRTYANLPFGGLIEELFTVAVGNMWNKIIANPDLDIKPALLAEIDVIAQRIHAAKR